MSAPNQPFSAIIGHERLKLALILNAIDPSISGVLIKGPRGTGKSTIARALADLLQDAPFVNVPLSTTEDKLCGSLSLEKVLKDQEVRFEPGLLAKAHNGVLYVDEVNLLADNLIDQLLDVAASGVNRIERDAISHEHAAEFALIGTMNPEEGELRPQLLDRFGLCVHLENPKDIEARMAMARQSRAFAQDHKSVLEQTREQNEKLAQMIQNARNNLSQVNPLNEEAERDIAMRCQLAMVDGIRADIIMAKAATAYCALIEQKNVDANIIEKVAQLVLEHRSNVPPPSSENEEIRAQNDNQVNNNIPQNQGNEGGLANELVAILGSGINWEETNAKKH